jgi:hypothetical protein
VDLLMASPRPLKEDVVGEAPFSLVGQLGQVLAGLSTPRGGSSRRRSPSLQFGGLFIQSGSSLSHRVADVLHVGLDAERLEFVGDVDGPISWSTLRHRWTMLLRMFVPPIFCL